jgi:hypothetical protein
MKAVTDRPVRIRTTEAQIDAALAAARKRKATAARIVSASFDAKRDAIVVTLSTHSQLVVPRDAIVGFSTVDPADLADLAPQSSGFSVWSDRADAGVRVETLLEAAAGSTLLVSSAARIVAAHSSPAKAAAARANGRKGGRPRKGAPAHGLPAKPKPAASRKKARAA